MIAKSRLPFGRRFLFSLNLLLIVAVIFALWQYIAQLGQFTSGWTTVANASTPLPDEVNPLRQSPDDVLPESQPFVNELLHDNYRLTLLSCGRITVFQKHEKGPQAVPYLEFFYIFEDVSKEPINTWNSGSVKAEFMGRPIHDVDTEFASFDLDKMPNGTGSARISNPSRCMSIRYRFREDKSLPSRATLVISAGINGNPHTFRFENVPVR